MKRKSRKICYLVGIFVVITLIGFYTNVAADTQYFIQMRATSAGNDLVITTNKKDAGCLGGAGVGKGCVKAAQKEGLQITFMLAGESSCDEGGNSGNWKLKRVYLGGFDLPDKPAAFGFPAATPPADYAKVKGDFKVADKTTGLLTLEANPQTDRIISISDTNNTSVNPYDVWYQVQADCVDIDNEKKVLKTISTDPRIRNGGTG